MNRSTSETVSSLVGPLAKIFSDADAAEAHHDELIENTRRNLVAEYAWRLDPRSQETWHRVIKAAGYSIADIENEGRKLRERRIVDLLEASMGYHEAHTEWRRLREITKELQRELGPEAKRRKDAERISSRAHAKQRPLGDARQKSLHWIGLVFHRELVEARQLHRVAEEHLGKITSIAWGAARQLEASGGNPQGADAARAKLARFKEEAEKASREESELRRKVAAIERQKDARAEKALATAEKAYAAKQKAAKKAAKIPAKASA